MSLITGILSICILLPVQALTPLYIKGNRFIQPAPDGDKVFFLKGMDYQPGGSSGFHQESLYDVLSNPAVCYRDAKVLQTLGVNVIRIYNLNVDVNHDACASIFNAAGIYLLLDVNSPVQSINRYDPESSYNLGYVTRLFQFIEAFKLYPNVAGFFAGNEVINDSISARLSPKYIRAVQRDMKQYMAEHSNRQIPVGYSSVDDTSFREDSWEYFRCSIPGESGDISRSDFYGVNTYSWCGARDDFKTSGYDKLESVYSSTNLPFIFSEYGCNTVRPRVFHEVSRGLYGRLSLFASGGLIYEYSEEENGYGIARVNPDGSVHLLEDYDHLREQYRRLQLPTIAAAEVVQTAAPMCSLPQVQEDGFSVSILSIDYHLPEQPAGVDALIRNGVSSRNIGQIVDVNYTALENHALQVFDSQGKPRAIQLNA
ncbi:glycoside hydrolase family 72 protein [Babjeviella inositovora NRRL Y-12698]|uniref:1,3-beta-glucanosyltransferase n=1 Tax=Babjeviella inositovora NRRL Y-12698 TaxID=984486 RepID=A0A1E3QQB6_9ASCO|nr:glycoside hydrolase family 72 protein [Babjeviella inositovora NRRL Y-12698]ODQ79838.1 glycoside hydrolase family 72 protein [Babjeviella inositovora NRRL Y-12698]